MSIGSILGIGRGKKAANLAFKGFDYAKDNPLLQKAQGAGAGALDAAGGALGLPGFQSQDASFKNFLDSLGFRNQLESGTDALKSAYAAGPSGLNSGAALKGITRFGQNLGQQGFGQYLQNLFNLASGGQSAALGTAAAGTAGGETAAKTQPEKTGILGRLFGI